MLPKNILDKIKIYLDISDAESDVKKQNLSPFTFIGVNKLLYNDSGTYKAHAEWVRAAQTQCIEKLLLNSLASNYKTGYYKLNSLK